MISPAAEGPPLRVTAACPLSPFDVELISIFAKLHGRRLVPVEPSSRDPAAVVAAGAADLIAGMVAEAAAGELPTTHEVLPTRLVAVTRRPGARAAAIEMLRRLRIGILRGSRARGAVQAAKISGAELVEYGRLDQATAGLREGSVTVLLLELPDAFTTRRGDGELEFGTFVGAKGSIVYGVPDRDRLLAVQLDRYLEGLRGTPSWSSLVARHYGPEALDLLVRAALAP